MKKSDHNYLGRIVYAAEMAFWPRAFAMASATVAKVVAVRSTTEGYVLTLETSSGLVGKITEETLIERSRLASEDKSLHPDRDDTFIGPVQHGRSNRYQVVIVGDGGKTDVMNDEPGPYQLPTRWAEWMERTRLVP